MNAVDHDATNAWSGPRSFDDFEIVRPLGRGGMGLVFLARDTVLDRPVALKFTAAEDPSPSVRARFLREARAIARLSHPNVVGIYRIGEVQGRPYIAYEFVGGNPLDEARMPMPWTRVARVALGMARGLAAAHQAGVLHRDVKPGNVMLTDAGEVKLIDFGLARMSEASLAVVEEAPAAGPVVVDASAVTLPDAPGPRAHTGTARLTHAGAVMGTPLYMPPEVWLREPATERSDLYAFGVVLFELLTGTLPHGGRGRELHVDDILYCDAPLVESRCAGVLPSLAVVVNRCLRRDPRERPATTDEVVKTLEQICALFLPDPQAAASLREDRDAALVGASLDRALAQGDALTLRVYEMLFARRPDLRPLFPADLEPQRQKLRHALKLSVEGLSEHARIEPVLHDLGRRHAGLGLVANDYAVLGEVMVAALREVDPGLDADTEAAWLRAYTFVANAMRKGEASGVREARTSSQTGSASRVVAERPSAPASPGQGSDRPSTRYAYVGDVGLAWQAFGREGRDVPDVLLQLGRVSHVDHIWRHPRPASFLRTFGQMGRAILYDKRGTGLSERAVEVPRFQERIEDVLAVLDAAESSRAVIVGFGEGAPTALLAAAMFPERVRGVVCFNGAARFLKAPDYPAGVDPSLIEQATERIRKHWGDPLFVEAEAPSMAHEPEFRAWFGEYLRSAASPGHIIAQLKLNAALDFRKVLPLLRAPTLVMHRAENRLSPAAGGRYLAEHIQGARFVELPGGDHVPFAGDLAYLREIERFVREIAGNAPSPPALTTFCLARADQPDAPMVKRATERLTAVGAKVIRTTDPGEVLVGGPWFSAMLNAALKVVGGREARTQGLRIALHAGLYAPLEATAAPPLDALRGALREMSAGSCMASAIVQELCGESGVEFDPDDTFTDARSGVTFAGASR